MACVYGFIDIKQSVPFSISVAQEQHVSKSPDHLQGKKKTVRVFLPLGRKARTLTTTLTLPPGVGLGGALIALEDTTTLSRDLKDGLEAVDCMAVEDIIDKLVAEVLALTVEIPEIELVDECVVVCSRRP